MSTALALAPQQMNFGELERLATHVAKSALFGCRTPESALTLMMLAQAEGKHPIQAMREYHIIENKPSMRADAIQARFQEQGGVVKWTKRTDSEVRALFSHPVLQPDPIEVVWDDAKVKKAGIRLTDKYDNPTNHAKYPLAMKSARVISEGVRAIMPGVVVGLYTPEEIQEFDQPAAPTEPKKKKVQSVEVTRTDQPGAGAASSDAPQDGPDDLMNDAVFGDSLRQLAGARGITKEDTDAGLADVLAKMNKTLSDLNLSGREAILAGIRNGKSDKWKGLSKSGNADDGREPPKSDDENPSKGITAADLAVLGEADFAKAIHLAADDDAMTAQQIKTGITRFAHDKGKTSKSLTGPEKLELLNMVEAKQFDWETGKRREQAAAAV